MYGVPRKGPLVVNLGGGVNSTAMLIGMRDRGIRPDAVVFADTKGEKPATYEHVAEMSSWLSENDMPEVSIADNRSKHKSLEEECKTNQTLPSIVFGNKGCSFKWKKQPIEQWLREWPPAIECWGRGEKVVQAIGIDWGEFHRAKDFPSKKFRYWHPLVEWEWDRQRCLEAIDAAGLKRPMKSACFFCPSSKKHEIRTLRDHYPELFARAVAMEHASADRLTQIKGLGRNWSWESFGDADEAQGKLFPDLYREMPCMCFDGEED